MPRFLFMARSCAPRLANRPETASRRLRQSINLLMGRGWPPTAKDFDEAEAICRELGLGNLLNRMPAGLLQMVGETGWQLSHGERSRLYMARAILQNADLVILDESFAALDPENLRQCLECAPARQHPAG